jgi:hypothetical protein
MTSTKIQLFGVAPDEDSKHAAVCLALSHARGWPVPGGGRKSQSEPSSGKPRARCGSLMEIELVESYIAVR